MADLQKQVDDLQKAFFEFQKRTSFNELPAMVRFRKNVSLVSNTRLRLEPTRDVTSAITGQSVQGEQLAGALITGTTLVTSIDCHSMGNAGKWVASSNSNTPLLVTITGNTNNQSIKASSGIFANYIILNNTSGASADLTGLGASEAGQEIVLLNISAQNVVIKNNSASSDAANRIYAISGADVTLAQHQSIRLRYRADVSIGSYITETRTGWQETN